MTLSEQIAQIEAENKCLRERVETLEQQTNESPALTELLDLLEPQVVWAETTTDRIHRRDFYSKLIKAYRELRPKE